MQKLSPGPWLLRCSVVVVELAVLTGVVSVVEEAASELVAALVVPVVDTAPAAAVVAAAAVDVVVVVVEIVAAAAVAFVADSEVVVEPTVELPKHSCSAGIAEVLAQEA